MIGSVCALVIGGGMFIFAEQLIDVFNSEADMVITTLGAFKVRSLCLVLIPHIMVMITSNLYQSLGLPVGNLVLSMSRQLLVLIPILLTLPRFFGEYGLAGAQALSDFISFAFLAVPLLWNLMRKIKKLNDGEDAPFGSVKARRR
jgi:Na+-driven multidrug efflux pump